jgi:hypothetical protein
VPLEPLRLCALLSASMQKPFSKQLSPEISAEIAGGDGINRGRPENTNAKSVDSSLPRDQSEQTLPIASGADRPTTPENLYDPRADPQADILWAPRKPPRLISFPVDDSDEDLQPDRPPTRLPSLLFSNLNEHISRASESFGRKRSVSTMTDHCSYSRRKYLLEDPPSPCPLQIPSPELPVRNGVNLPVEENEGLNIPLRPTKPNQLLDTTGDPDQRANYPSSGQRPSLGFKDPTVSNHTRYSSIDQDPLNICEMVTVANRHAGLYHTPPTTPTWRPHRPAASFVYETPASQIGTPEVSKEQFRNHRGPSWEEYQVLKDRVDHLEEIVACLSQSEYH